MYKLYTYIHVKISLLFLVITYGRWVGFFISDVYRNFGTHMGKGWGRGKEER